MARISRPCPFERVKTSTGRPSGRRPKGARVTIGEASDRACFSTGQVLEINGGAIT